MAERGVEGRPQASLMHLSGRYPELGAEAGRQDSGRRRNSDAAVAAWKAGTNLSLILNLHAIFPLAWLPARRQDRLLRSDFTAQPVHFVLPSNELGGSFSVRVWIPCYGYAWQPENADVPRPGTSYAPPDCNELLEFPAAKHRKV